MVDRHGRIKVAEEVILCTQQILYLSLRRFPALLYCRRVSRYPILWNDCRSHNADFVRVPTFKFGEVHSKVEIGSIESSQTEIEPVCPIQEIGIITQIRTEVHGVLILAGSRLRRRSC